MEFKRIGVVGGGTMGAGIAEICARSRLDVLVHDVSGSALSGVRQRIEQSLARAQQRRKLSVEDRRQALERIRFTTELEGLADRDLVIEAASEDRPTKIAIFSALAGILDGDRAGVIASNTSSIPIVELAVAADGRGADVIGLHFFNPVPIMSLVEVIPCLLTSADTAQRVTVFASATLGKRVIHAPDKAGFMVNALLIPYLLAAIRMLEQGQRADDIDEGMVLGCGHPMGPLALADLIGLDTVLGVAETMFQEHREALYAPPPLLSRLVAANLLGRKTGRGLLDYYEEPPGSA